MLAASGSFATLVSGVEMYAAWRIQITLPAAASAFDDVTLAVERLEIDASTTTDMPEGSRLQVGYPAMGCTFTLSGLVDRTDESKTAGWLFGRYNTTSPLYRTDVLYCPVTVDLGLYTDTSGGTPEFVRKFTGSIDSYTVGDDGSVAFDCIDAIRQALRSTPAIPAVITAPPYNAGLTSEFAIDALLRAATNEAISSWPAQRANCLLAVGLRTSLWPELGTLNTSGDQPNCVFGTGAYGSGLTQVVDPVGPITFPTWNMNGKLTTGATSLFVEAFIYGLDSVGGVILSVGHVDGFGFEADVQLDIGHNTIVTSTGAGGTTWFTTVSSALHYVAAQYTWHSTTYDVTFTLDATTHTVTGIAYTAGGPPGAIADWDSAAVDIVPGVAVAAFQVTTESAGPSNAGFTPRAVLDPSLNTLTVVPAIDQGDPFSAIQQIADAELGVAGGDESGVFRFYNRQTIRQMASSRDVTSAASLESVGGQETTAAGVINHATVEATPWSFGAANTNVWTSDVGYLVKKKSTRTLTVTSESPFASPDLTFANLPNGSSDVTTSRMRVSMDKYGANEHPGGVTVTAVQTSSTTAVLTMVNSSGQNAYFVSPASYVDLPVGTPLLRLSALAVTQGDPVSRDYQFPPVSAGGAASTRFGEQATTISGNPWIQDDDTALQLAVDIVADQSVPRPNLTGVAIIPDPRIQVIDVVRLLDPDRTNVNEYARVFGYAITWEGGQPMTYGQTLDARTVAAPGGWIGGVAGRSEGGTTTFGYG